MGMMRLLSEALGSSPLLVEEAVKTAQVPEYSIPVTMVMSSVSAALIGGGMACMTAYRHLAGLVNMKLQTYIVRIVLIVPIIVAEIVTVLFFGPWLPGFSLLFVVARDLWEALVIDTFLSFILESTGGEISCARSMAIEPGVVSHLPPITWFLPDDGWTLKLPTQGSKLYALQYLETLYEQFTHGVGQISGADRENEPRRSPGRDAGGGYSSYYVAKIVPCTPIFVKWCKRGTLQFVITKPVMAFLRVILFLAGLDGWLWHWFELTVYNLSYSVALYSLCLFYTAVKFNPELKPVKPLRKFVAVKLVVFATFWQNLVIAILAMINNIIFENTRGVGVATKFGNAIMTDEYTSRLGVLILGFELPFFAAAIAWAYPLDEFSRLITGEPSTPSSGLSPFHHDMGCNTSRFSIDMNSMVELERQVIEPRNQHVVPLIRPSLEESRIQIPDRVDSLHLEEGISPVTTGIPRPPLQRKKSLTLDDRPPPTLGPRRTDPIYDIVSEGVNVTTGPFPSSNNSSLGSHGLYCRRDARSMEHLDMPDLNEETDTEGAETPKRIRGLTDVLGGFVPNGDAWDAAKARKMLLGTLKAPKRIGQTVVYGMVETTDQGKRDVAKKNLSHVLNMNDIMDEVRVNFAGKYFDHSLINGEPVRATTDETPTLQIHDPTSSDPANLMHVFELEDPFDLHSSSDDVMVSVNEEVPHTDAPSRIQPPPPPPPPPPQPISPKSPLSFSSPPPPPPPPPI